MCNDTRAVSSGEVEYIHDDSHHDWPIDRNGRVDDAGNGHEMPFDGTICDKMDNFTLLRAARGCKKGLVGDACRWWRHNGHHGSSKTYLWQMALFFAYCFITVAPGRGQSCSSHVVQPSACFEIAPDIATNGTYSTSPTVSCSLSSAVLLTSGTASACSVDVANDTMLQVFVDLVVTTTVTVAPGATLQLQSTGLLAPPTAATGLLDVNVYGTLRLDNGAHVERSNVTCHADCSIHAQGSIDLAATVLRIFGALAADPSGAGTAALRDVHVDVLGTSGGTHEWSAVRVVGELYVGPGVSVQIAGDSDMLVVVNDGTVRVAHNPEGGSSAELQGYAALANDEGQRGVLIVLIGSNGGNPVLISGSGHVDTELGAVWCNVELEGCTGTDPVIRVLSGLATLSAPAVASLDTTPVACGSADGTVDGAATCVVDAEVGDQGLQVAAIIERDGLLDVRGQEETHLASSAQLLGPVTNSLYERINATDGGLETMPGQQSRVVLAQCAQLIGTLLGHGVIVSWNASANPCSPLESTSPFVISVGVDSHVELLGIADPTMSPISTTLNVDVSFNASIVSTGGGFDVTTVPVAASGRDACVVARGLLLQSLAASHCNVYYDSIDSSYAGLVLLVSNAHISFGPLTLGGELATIVEGYRTVLEDIAITVIDGGIYLPHWPVSTTQTDILPLSIGLTVTGRGRIAVIVQKGLNITLPHAVSVVSLTVEEHEAVSHPLLNAGSATTLLHFEHVDWSQLYSDQEGEVPQAVELASTLTPMIVTVDLFSVENVASGIVGNGYELIVGTLSMTGLAAIGNADSGCPDMVRQDPDVERLCNVVIHDLILDDVAPTSELFSVAISDRIACGGRCVQNGTHAFGAFRLSNSIIQGDIMIDESGQQLALDELLVPGVDPTMVDTPLLAVEDCFVSENVTLRVGPRVDLVSMSVHANDSVVVIEGGARAQILLREWADVDTGATPFNGSSVVYLEGVSYYRELHVGVGHVVIGSGAVTVVSEWIIVVHPVTIAQDGVLGLNGPDVTISLVDEGAGAVYMNDAIDLFVISGDGRLVAAANSSSSSHVVGIADVSCAQPFAAEQGNSSVCEYCSDWPIDSFPIQDIMTCISVQGITMYDNSSIGERAVHVAEAAVIGSNVTVTLLVDSAERLPHTAATFLSTPEELSVESIMDANIFSSMQVIMVVGDDATSVNSTMLLGRTSRIMHAAGAMSDIDAHVSPQDVIDHEKAIQRAGQFVEAASYTVGELVMQHGASIVIPVTWAGGPNDPAYHALHTHALHTVASGQGGILASNTSEFEDCADDAGSWGGRLFLLQATNDAHAFDRVVDHTLYVFHADIHNVTFMQRSPNVSVAAADTASINYVSARFLQDVTGVQLYSDLCSGNMSDGLGGEDAVRANLSVGVTVHVRLPVAECPPVYEPCIPRNMNSNEIEEQIEVEQSRDRETVIVIPLFMLLLLLLLAILACKRRRGRQTFFVKGRVKSPEDEPLFGHSVPPST